MKDKHGLELLDNAQKSGWEYSGFSSTHLDKKIVKDGKKCDVMKVTITLIKEPK